MLAFVNEKKRTTNQNMAIYTKFEKIVKFAFILLPSKILFGIQKKNGIFELSIRLTIFLHHSAI